MRTALLAAAWLAATSAPARADRFALIVGADQGDASEVVLRFAETDASRIQRTLRRIGGFRVEDMILLNGGHAEEVRRAAIELNARVRQGGPDSMLFVFYSGHADAESLHLHGTRLPMAELRGLVAGSAAGVRVLVVDACRSGAITRLKGGHPGPTFDVHVESPAAAEGVAILTSSAAGEDSQESDQLTGSFFTHFLVSALAGAADLDGDGAVTLSEAFSYSSSRTLSATAATVAGPQHPTYRLDLGGREDIVLTRPHSADSTLGHLLFTEPGWYLVARRDGTIATEVQSDAGTREVALETGNYKITRREPGGLRESEVHVEEGSSTVVSPDRMRQLSYAQVVRKGGTTRRSLVGIQALLGIGFTLIGAAPAIGIDIRVDLRQLFIDSRISYMPFFSQNTFQFEQGGELTTELAIGRAFDFGPLALSIAATTGVYINPSPYYATPFGVLLGVRPQALCQIGRHGFITVDGGPQAIFSYNLFKTFTANVGGALMAGGGLNF